MVSLPDGEKISKISLFVFEQLTNVTDGRTDGQTDRRTDRQRVTAYRAYAYASRGKKQWPKHDLFGESLPTDRGVSEVIIENYVLLSAVICPVNTPVPQLLPS